MFFDNVLIAAKQVIILYIIVAVGAIADKTKLFTAKTAKLCTDLLFYIVCFCVIVQSFLQMDNSAQNTKNLFIAMGCGMLMHLIAALITLPFFRKCDANHKAIFRYSVVFGNCGYMALPLAQAVIGNDGVFYCSAVVVSFQICSFTYGIYLMNADSEGKTKFNIKNIIFNPGVIAVLVGLPLYLLKITIPEMVMQPISYISSMNTPLAMLIFGTYLANTNFKSIFKEPKILLVALLKLIILPLILLGVFKLFSIGGVLLSSLILSASAPSANNTVMFAAKYDRDTGLAAQTVSAVSLISILTMPALIALSLTIN